MESKEQNQPMSQRSANFFAEIQKNVVPRIEKSTISIVGIQENKIIHDRTGVLYSIAGEHFVLTAAHTLQRTVSYNIPLFLSVNTPHVLPFSLEHAKFHSTEEEDRDVSVIWLPPEIGLEVSKHKIFLRHNQIDFEVNENKGLFMFFGYPLDWSAKLLSEDTLLSTGIAFAGHPYSGEREPSAKYHPDVHMGLQFSREVINLGNNKYEHLPHPKGISGCGIWQIGEKNYETKTISSRTADTISLVGIWSAFQKLIQML